MLTGLENGLGLDIVLWLQEHSTGGLDNFAEVLDFLGSSLFFIIFIPLFYWSIDKHLGRRLLFALLLGSALSVGLKLIFKTPRPFIAHPDEVKQLVEANSYGFPSGHTTNAVVVAGVLALWFRRRWLTIGAIIYVLLMGWARMTAGVHYPQDVVGGILLGSLVLFIVHQYEDEFILYWGQISWRDKVIMLIAVGAGLVALMWNDDDGIKITSVIIGGGIGIVLEDEFVGFVTPPEWPSRIIRYILGIFVALAVFFGLRVLFGSADPEPLFKLIRYSVVGMLIAWIYPMTMQRLQTS